VEIYQKTYHKAPRFWQFRRFLANKEYKSDSRTQAEIATVTQFDSAFS